MPWSVSDVDRHKHGLNPKQKKKWVRIANAILGRTGDEGLAIATASKRCGESVRMSNRKLAERLVEGSKTKKVLHAQEKRRIIGELFHHVWQEDEEITFVELIRKGVPTNLRDYLSDPFNKEFSTWDVNAVWRFVQENTDRLNIQLLSEDFIKLVDDFNNYE